MTPRAPLTLLEAASLGAALAAADSQGLLMALTAGPDTFQGYAERLNLNPAATKSILEVLRTMGFVDHQQNSGYYSADPSLELAMAGMASRPGIGLGIFSAVHRFLQTGDSMQPQSETAEGREKVYPRVVEDLAKMFSGPARQLADALAESDCRHILDVGAGSGHWSMAQLQCHPQARLTLLDLPQVLEVAKERAERLGLSDRIDLLAGDFHSRGLPEGKFDRIILANVLHLEPAEKAEKLLRSLSPVMQDKGKFVIIDSMASDTLEQDRTRRAYALFLALRIRDGYPHSEATLRKWLAGCGYGRARRLDLEQGQAALSALITE